MTDSAATKYANVAFNLPIKDLFTYSIPDELNGIALPGARVLAPFGTRRLTGYVVELVDTASTEFKIKSLQDVLDPKPIISENLMELTKWIADYYKSSWGEAIKAALPAGLEDEGSQILFITEEGKKELEENRKETSRKRILEALAEKSPMPLKMLKSKLKKKFSFSAVNKLKQESLIREEMKIARSAISYVREKLIRVGVSAQTSAEISKSLTRSHKQKVIYEILAEKERTLTELKGLVENPSPALNQLKKKGLAVVEEMRVARQGDGISDSSTLRDKPPELTPDQKIVFNEISKQIESNEYGTFLLHGVTGSGKTEIYLNAIQKALEQGRQAVMMVPEISLTPQTVTVFRKRFGNAVAILHSGLTSIERFLEWKKILEGRVSIAVGARSAVFAPFKKPGVFIIDEEHDSSYKQDSNPRYHARDAAIVRASNSGAAVILGSATPSLESRRNAETGKYRYLELKKRVFDRVLPAVKIVDMIKEREVRRNYSILSIDLKNAVRDRLKRGEQTFLFLNRRGAANFIFCKQCEFVWQCVRCSVSLTYHASRRRLECHYCNCATQIPKTCIHCGGEAVRFRSFGTEKLEEEVAVSFPKARLWRMDRDTTKKRSDFEAVFEKMSKREIDILIGTQMITKGHDFHNVTLVGVVQPDISLNIPDFRSGEKSFQLLAQVSGRAGRGESGGLAVIQTSNPDHYVYQFAKLHDYETFYKKELELREKLKYPPYSKLAAAEVESPNEEKGFALVNQIGNVFKRRASRSNGVEVLGPSRASIYQVKDNFRWHIILRSQDVGRLQQTVEPGKEIEELLKKAHKGIKFRVDVDPVNLF